MILLWKIKSQKFISVLHIIKYLQITAIQQLTEIAHILCIIFEGTVGSKYLKVGSLWHASNSGVYHI